MDTSQAQPGAEPNTIVVPDAKVTSETKTIWGLAGLQHPSPAFAKNLFVIFYSMNTSILGWIAYSHLLSQNQVYEAIGLFKFIIDPGCYTISKMFGITTITQQDNESKTP